jgi:hypothetical protein
MNRAGERPRCTGFSLAPRPFIATERRAEPNVSEHQIKLRGGWLCRAAGSPESAAQPLSLPTRWSPETPRHLLLVRRFGRPRLQDEGHTLLLRLDQVPGIQSLTLNGRRLEHPAAGASSCEITLDALIERNTLVLDVETPPPPPESTSNAPEWGFISLLIRPESTEPG